MIITDTSLLRPKCEDVLPSEVEELKHLLEKELKLSGELGSPGIGLAAPQIGIAKKMAIVRVKNPNGNVFNIDLVNIKNIKGYDEIIFDKEGCLSFPNMTVKTKRFYEIFVEGNMVKPFNFTATGLLSICIQHEWDHINGILLTDKAIETSKPSLVKSVLDNKIILKQRSGPPASEYLRAYDAKSNLGALKDFLKK